MTQLIPLPVVIPLVGAALCILGGRSRTAQRVVAVTALLATTGVSIALLVAADRDGPLVTQAGGWPAPIGITLVVDRLSGIMLTVGSLMLLAVLLYAIGQPGAERNHVGFQSAYLIMAAGVSASFVVGDLFTLFVAFEMMLTASYVLLTLGGGRVQVRAGMTYVVISLIASTLFVTALALVYSATGTVNMADLSGRMAELPPGVSDAFAVLLLVVFGIKAGLFPLFSWLPDAYPVAPAAVTAVFAGLFTKVGVYAMIRSQTLLFTDDSRPASLMLVLAGLTMVVGILGAIAQDDVRRILSFNIVSHIGFMVMGLALFSVAGLAAAIFYTMHHIVAKTTLFLTSGLIEHAGGSSHLSRLGNLVRTAPAVAVLFLVPALTLAGMPPLSGFAPKVGLIEAGFSQGEYTIVVVSLVASLLTLLSLMKIWLGAFWGEVTVEPELTVHRVGRLGGPALMVGPTVGLASVSIAIAVAAGPLYRLCERAAGDLLDPARYVEAVLGWVRYAAYAVGLAVAWVLLWDRLSAANFLAGLVVAALILVAVPLRSVAPEQRRRARLGPLVRLAGAALHDVVSSNWAMAVQILVPRRRLRTGVVACPMRTPSAKVLSTVSNILALSPDTTAVQATNDPPTLYVHCLFLDDVDQVRRKVAYLEAAVVAALGTRAEQAALEAVNQ